MEMKKFTRLSMLTALAVVLNIIESVIPLFNGYIPGLKLGLANTVILFVLYTFSFKDALYVSILRVILVGILRTGLFSIAFSFSLGGAILSVIMMNLFKKISSLSIIGISIIGSIFHSLGQIIVAIFLLENANMFYYLPWLLLFSIPTGIMVGIISKELVNYFKKDLSFN
ncbi:MAG: Gx transporter family protein [Bacilli bacterium]|nr:Gx transporter family protein [Bacilli bacterium]MDD4809137.1 Gx transporter family protein [Bacilli bacterium]